MHTVMKFVPLRGGGWLESQHALLPDGDILEQTQDERSGGGGGGGNGRNLEPIWGDSRSCLPHRMSLEKLGTMDAPTGERQHHGT